MSPLYTRQLLCIALLILLPSANVSASLIRLFGTDTAAGGTIVGDTFTLTQTGLVADGVTFNATLNIVGSQQAGGSGVTLIQRVNDLGIDTLGVADSTFVDNGESLTISMMISGEIGGTVNFDGFVEIDLNNFGTSDSGVLSLDNSAATTGDNFFTTAVGADVLNISGTSPTVFSAISTAEGIDTNTFGLGDVSAQFTGTAVPEPSSICLLAVVGAAAAFGRHRRRKRKNRSAGGE